MLVSLFKPCLAEFALSFRVTSWAYLKVQESNPVNSEATHFFIISLFSHFVFLQAAKCSKLFVCRIQTKSNSSAFDHKKSKELNKCLKFRSVSSSSINFRHLLCVVFISKSVHCHGVPGWSVGFGLGGPSASRGPAGLPGDGHGRPGRRRSVADQRGGEVPSAVGPCASC